MLSGDLLSHVDLSRDRSGDECGAVFLQKSARCMISLIRARNLNQTVVLNRDKLVQCSRRFLFVQLGFNRRDCRRALGHELLIPRIVEPTAPASSLAKKVSIELYKVANLTIRFRRTTEKFAASIVLDLRRE